jgi:hypothetical protein
VVEIDDLLKAGHVIEPARETQDCAEASGAADRAKAAANSFMPRRAGLLEPVFGAIPKPTRAVFLSSLYRL